MPTGQVTANPVIAKSDKVWAKNVGNYANRSRICAADPFAIAAPGVDGYADASSIGSNAPSVESGGGALRFACPNTGFSEGVDDVLP
ncbi:hypothetical protein HPB52_021179 [Rhipicephalus sanguineus]|uniref:Uncharacterized protein n=1 Tax=Rhipicephalus sanguineus TaxID=34632 RepID=A0A9D4PD79_RHISA|nr:hypothetical protein HPB52_021179 [Rhipicephalus sanguineus]